MYEFHHSYGITGHLGTEVILTRRSADISPFYMAALCLGSRVLSHPCTPSRFGYLVTLVRILGPHKIA